MEELKGQNINMNISNGDSFFAHQASLNFSPTQFFLDFKNITPRIDERQQNKPTLVLKHNVIVMEPFHLVKLQELLSKVIGKYEEEFGKIEKPKPIQILEKHQKKDSKSTKKKSKEGKVQMDYFG